MRCKDVLTDWFPLCCLLSPGGPLLSRRLPAPSSRSEAGNWLLRIQQVTPAAPEKSPPAARSAAPKEITSAAPWTATKQIQPAVSPLAQPASRSFVPSAAPKAMASAPPWKVLTWILTEPVSTVPSTHPRKIQAPAPERITLTAPPAAPGDVQRTIRSAAHRKSPWRAPSPALTKAPPRSCPPHVLPTPPPPTWTKR